MYIKYIDINKSKLYNKIINYSLNLELDEIIISIDKAERGYEGKYDLEIINNEDTFYVDAYIHKDITRFPTRIRTTATLLKNKNCFGWYNIECKNNKIIIKKINKKTSWKTDVIRALYHLNGKAHLSAIYKEVKTLRNGNLNPNWDRTIQRELETNSSDSKAFSGKEDLFYIADEKGKGLWGLRVLKQTPKYFVVFQGDTYREEKELSCLWAPIKDKAGKEQHHHKRLIEAQKGDRVIHIQKKLIKAISTIQDKAYECECPRELSRPNWLKEGRKINLRIIELDEFIDISTIFDKIKSHLPNIYSPFNKNGSGNQGYFYEINQNIFNIILNTDNEEGIIKNNVLRYPKGKSLNIDVKSNQRNSSWQKYFKNMLFEMWGIRCVVTGVDQKELLIGAHIKPFSKSDDSEKIDEYNGLPLAPNPDKLFEIGLISFDDEGKILISKKLDDKALTKLSIKRDVKIKIDEQHKKYLRYHRNNKFKN